jgi:hypothetical protein
LYNGSLREISTVDNVQYALCCASSSDFQHTNCSYTLINATTHCTGSTFELPVDIEAYASSHVGLNASHFAVVDSDLTGTLDMVVKLSPDFVIESNISAAISAGIVLFPFKEYVYVGIIGSSNGSGIGRPYYIAKVNAQTMEEEARVLLRISNPNGGFVQVFAIDEADEVAYIGFEYYMNAVQLYAVDLDNFDSAPEVIYEWASFARIQHLGLGENGTTLHALVQAAENNTVYTFLRNNSDSEMFGNNPLMRALPQTSPPDTGVAGVCSIGNHLLTAYADNSIAVWHTSPSEPITAEWFTLTSSVPYIETGNPPSTLDTTSFAIGESVPRVAMTTIAVVAAWSLYA